MRCKYLSALAFVASLTVCGACGPSTQLRIAYSTEVARCTTNERAIVDRADTTLEQDQTDLATERTRCDAALAAIEHGDN